MHDELSVGSRLYSVCMSLVFIYYVNTVEPLYSSHPRGTTFGPLYRGGLYEGLFGTQTVHLEPERPGRYIAVGLYSGGGRYIAIATVHIILAQHYTL